MTGPVPRGSARAGVPVGRLTLGILLIAIGLGAFADSAGWWDVPWEALLPSALILVGLGMIVGARAGRHQGLFVFGVIVTVLLALGTSARVSIGGGIGDRTIVATTAADLGERIELGVGDLGLDLSGLSLPAGTTEVHVSVGVGDVTVQLPASIETFVDARSSIGDITMPDASHGGFDQRVTYSTPNFEGATTSLVLDIRVSVGSIEVRA